ncbi:MAG: class I SAM-dependent methyltransferase [Zhongshania sp.]|jgi:2-polyprenyl-3-methyl-5-hydroxy-6-metoxy-1,4-benzoquinol methylase|nr:class I SAM-dependent methyltransferase [Zhongshania sp.]
MENKKSLPSTYFVGVRKEMLPFLPSRRQRVLEIGCGHGTFSEGVDGCQEYWGVEPDAEAAKIADQKLKKVLNGTYNEVADQLPDNYFDLIVCNDVIEHMPDHDEFLINIQRKIADGGALVASIPNVRYYYNLLELIVGKDWRYRDAGVLDRTHLRFFTRKSLLECLANAGFEVEEFQGINRLKTRILPLKRLFRHLVFLLLGDDVRYLQFAFRAVKKKT